MLRQRIRLRRLKITLSPCLLRSHVTFHANIVHWSDDVYFRVIGTCGYQLFCCVSRVPTLDDLKIWQRPILSSFLEGPNKFGSGTISLSHYYWESSGSVVVRALVSKEATTIVARVRFPNSAWYSGWVCWFPTLLWEVFPLVLQFSPLLKNLHLIKFDLY